MWEVEQKFNFEHNEFDMSVRQAYDNIGNIEYALRYLYVNSQKYVFICFTSMSNLFWNVEVIESYETG